MWMRGPPPGCAPREVKPANQSYACIQAYVPDNRQPGQTSLAAATNGCARPSAKAAAASAGRPRNRTARPTTESVEVSWKMKGSSSLPSGRGVFLSGNVAIQRVVDVKGVSEQLSGDTYRANCTMEGIKAKQIAGRRLSNGNSCTAPQSRRCQSRNRLGR